VIFISSWCCDGLSRSAGAGGSGMMQKYAATLFISKYIYDTQH
jgi:hypothetical protein